MKTTETYQKRAKAMKMERTKNKTTKTHKMNMRAKTRKIEHMWQNKEKASKSKQKRIHECRSEQK